MTQPAIAEEEPRSASSLPVRLVRRAIRRLASIAPWAATLLARASYPFPRTYIFASRYAGRFDLIAQRAWRIRSGPLAGCRLVGLLPDEIAPVLGNVMEPLCAEELGRLDLAGATVVDVGASYGYYALLLAKLVGPAGRVYSCDPDPDSFARLAGNLALNRVPNVIALPLCIAEAGGDGLRRWVSFADAPWNSRLASDAAPEEAASGRVVAVSSIDRVADALGIGRAVRLLKIDVEGAEGLVLRGAEGVLDQAKPAVLCELHGRDAAEAVFAVLGRHGYTWRAIDEVSDLRYHILALPGGSSHG